MDKDSIVYGFNLTFSDLMDMVNYMNDSKEDEINELTQEQIDELCAYLGDAVTDALTEFIQELRD